MKQIAKYLSLCNDVISLVPDDIWKLIFSFHANRLEGNSKDGDYFPSLEAFFQALVCVCCSFSSIIPDLLQVYFGNFPTHSNWVLKNLAPFLTELTISRKDTKISNESLSILTNLNHLKLNDPSNFSNNTLQNLTKLTSLHISHNQSISNQGVSFMTLLQTLSLKGDTKITDEGLLKMTNLTRLELQGKSLVSNNCVSQLTNLVELNLLSNPGG